MHSAQGRRDAVIVYHAIGRVQRSAARWNGFIRPERFAAQMSYLAEHRRVVDLDALFEPDPSPGPPRVAITFDDGYRSVLEHGLPRAARARVPGDDLRADEVDRRPQHLGRPDRRVSTS